jgi:transcriptional regulator with XRE-family HTH domain
MDTKIKTHHDEDLTHQLDSHIGRLIKRLRIRSRITHTDLSHASGVSVQQIQKYENATNRVSASRLYWIARALRTSPNYFFDSFVSQNNTSNNLSDNQQEQLLIDIPKKISEEELISTFFAIKDPAKRQWYLDHMKQDSSQE